MYVLLAFGIALAAYLLASVALSTLVAMAAKLVPPPAGSHAERARALFFLRIFPGLLAAGLVIVVVVPSYLLLEPKGTGESPSVSLLALAVAGLALLLFSSWRGLASLRESARLAAAWLKDAQPMPGGARGAFYRVERAFPPACVLGVFRAKVFVSSAVVQALSGDELRVVLAHEAAHMRRRDNLKRLLLYCVPDLLGLFPAGRALEREWERESEFAADAWAASGSAKKALDLSSALITVARLVPDECESLEPFACLHGPGSVSERVQVLLEQDVGGPRPRPRRVFLVAAGLVVVGLCVEGPLILTAVHGWTETLVRLLP